MAKKTYKKFPGSRTFLAKDTLWIAADHLLYVVLWFISEDYKRFYFKDIQSVTIHRTPTWKRLNILFPVLGMISALVALTLGEVGRILLWIVAGCIFFFFLVNLILGPTCECHIQTAVQTVKLTPLTRIRRTRKVVQHLIAYANRKQASNA